MLNMIKRFEIPIMKILARTELFFELGSIPNLHVSLRDFALPQDCCGLIFYFLSDSSFKICIDHPF
jgi:hypothetical protein